LNLLLVVTSTAVVGRSSAIAVGLLGLRFVGWCFVGNGGGLVEATPCRQV
jgi:hypothetical protein